MTETQDVEQQIRQLRNARTASVGAVLHPRPTGINARDWRDILSEPTLAGSIFRLGAERWSQDGREREALALFRSASELGDRRAATALGEGLVWVGEDDEAERVLKNVIQDQGDEAGRAKLVLARLLMKKLAWSDAEDRLREILTDEPDAAADLGHLLIDQERWDEARAVLEEFLIQGNDRVPIVLGNLLNDHYNDPEGAEAAYLVGIERGDAYSAFNLALLLRGERRFSEAESYLRWAAEKGDDRASLLLEEQ